MGNRLKNRDMLRRYRIRDITAAAAMSQPAPRNRSNRAGMRVRLA
jgi:hypothetical protein